MGVCDHKLATLINTVIFETKWFIWTHRNKCKHSGETQNIKQYEYMLKYNLKFQLKCTRLISYCKNIIEGYDDFISTL